MAASQRRPPPRGTGSLYVIQPSKYASNKGIPFADYDTDYLTDHQEPWVFTKEDPWHGFADIEKDYVMLDPIKLTITTPGIDDSGKMGDWGIPASILTNYLIAHNIVCEKTDYYSFLMLNSLATTGRNREHFLRRWLNSRKNSTRTNRCKPTS